MLENPTVNGLEPRAGTHRILAFAARETFPLLVVASTALVLAEHLISQLSQDGWLAFLSGRIVAHGDHDRACDRQLRQVLQLSQPVLARPQQRRVAGERRVK